MTSRNYYNCVYLLINHKNKTYYCGKAQDLNHRVSSHKKYNITDEVYILEKDCITIDMEYVWLYYFNTNYKRGWKCINVDYNTGLRFKMATKSQKISAKDLKDSNYYKYCLNGVIRDTTGLL